MLGEGSWSWAGLACYVIAYDVWAIKTNRQTLSAAFYKAVANPSGRYGVILAWAYLSGHLFKILPRRYDPIYRLAERLFDGQETD